MAPRSKWVDEPPRRRNLTAVTRRRDAAVEELKTRPGEWMLVESGKAHRSASQHWQARGCETTCRTTVDGTVDVYARWPEPTPDLSASIPYIAARRARGIPTEGTNR